jgi:hypothetical protein
MQQRLTQAKFCNKKHLNHGQRRLQTKTHPLPTGIEFLCKLTYNHLTESIKIKDAHFGNHTWKSMHEDYEAETGKKFMSRL